MKPAARWLLAVLAEVQTAESEDGTRENNFGHQFDWLNKTSL
jgi:hypothetical protein